MKANELPINNFLQAPNVQFVIPVYQRNYDWTVNECSELLNDIITVEKEKRGTHFIGSIVLIHEGTYSTNDVKELVIIDGQQRLTTINILYVALYRFAKENCKNNEAEMLYNMFLTNQYAQAESNKLKLKQTDTNSDAFKAILENREDAFGKFSNVIENHNYFRSKINNDNFNTILNGIKQLIFVEISLERGKDDPQRIFESLNSTGLDLSQSDLIRNFILMDLDPKEQLRVFKQIWNPIEENSRDYTRQKSMVSDYIRDYLTLKNKKIPNKGKVYLEFKKLYANNKNEAFYQDLENIKSLSFHYKKLINPSSASDNNLRTQLEYINRLEINVAYPFLLQVLEDADNGIIDNKTLIKVLELIQNYTWRRFIVGLPTNALNKIFMTLYSEINTEEYYDSMVIALIQKKGTSKFPSDNDLLSALKDKDLYNIQTKNRNYMFERLENYNNREFVDTSNEKITIEHIFPQNPDEQWNSDLSSNDLLSFKEKYLNTVANLTLSGNNGALSNKCFKEKQSMNANEGEQGYQFSRLWLNKYLNKINLWNIENYNKRFDIISNRFLNIWKYPEVILPILKQEEAVNIFNAEKPTHKKLEYFEFDNTKIEENIIAQMYFYVIRKLYKKNAEFLIAQQETIKISRREEQFRAPQELTNGYFIESNIDSNTKFNTLKRLLSIFELEDYLYIKYSTNPPESTDSTRYIIRRNYWKQLLPLLKDTSLFNNVNPSRDHWIGSGAGISGMSFTLSVTGIYTRIELSISSSIKERNKQYFKLLYQNKTEIETRFGKKLIWEELPENKMCRIKYELENVNLFDEQYWTTMNEFIINYLPKFESALKPEIKKIKNRRI